MLESHGLIHEMYTVHQLPHSMQHIYMSCVFNRSAQSIDCPANLIDRLNGCHLMDPLNG